MGTYLSIVAGAIRLFNALAQALQQHHDELAGAAKQREGDDAARNAELARVSSPVSRDDAERMWNADKAKFGPPPASNG